VCIMTCSGFNSYGLVNHNFYKSKSLHRMRSKFISSNWPCLKWENVIFVIPSLSKNYIPSNPILSLIEYSFKKKTLTKIMPILEAMRDIMLEKMETFITYFWVIPQIHFFSSKTKRKKLYSKEIQKRKSLSRGCRSA